jgi:hypothetical protein
MSGRLWIARRLRAARLLFAPKEFRTVGVGQARASPRTNEIEIAASSETPTNVAGFDIGLIVFPTSTSTQPFEVIGALTLAQRLSTRPNIL